jgi:hypothetical protein
LHDDQRDTGKVCERPLAQRVIIELGEVVEHEGEIGNEWGNV